MEHWKKVVNYQDYEISNLGNVKSLKFNKNFILKKTKANTGYFFVNLSNKGKSYPINIHRLVAENFIANNDNTLHVNHINGIKTDNRVENLEWISNSDNLKHAHKNQLIKNRGEFHVMSKLKRVEVEKIKEMLLSGEKQKTISNFFNVDQAVISNIKLNKSY